MAPRTRVSEVQLRVHASPGGCGQSLSAYVLRTGAVCPQPCRCKWGREAETLSIARAGARLGRRTLRPTAGLVRQQPLPRSTPAVVFLEHSKRAVLRDGGCATHEPLSRAAPSL